jgi:hypothetical protein
MLSAHEALTYAAALVGAGSVLTTLEYLYLFRVKAFAKGGWLDWKVVKLLYDNPLRAMPDVFWGPTALFLVLLMRLVTAILLVVPVFFGQQPAAWAITVLLLTTIFLQRRLPYGTSGADQMAGIITVALFIGLVFPGTLFAAQASAWFIAAQATLAYLSSGLSKAFSHSWRSGRSLFLILNTELFGNRTLLRFFEKRPALASIVNWLVIPGWLIFPSVYIIPSPYNLIILCFTGSMHVAIALAMRLNGFPWFFIATYPLVVYVAGVIQYMF